MESSNYLLETRPAYPDFAGIGVIVAFAASVSLTLVAAIVCLLLSRSTKPSHPRAINPIDGFFPDGSIAVYHVDTVTNFVWFSSNTHLLSLHVVKHFNACVKPDAGLRRQGRPR
ncbi:hypothetical protein GGS23DRAFT_597940 [Durotheca rogersii]|uniref:uncharacterized protein n=1 Tax=Durotheca rogersii TaxID=419775 RepID=UPI00221FE7F9|nr:uncharacterized protein GGS23DRAFT_597940 [Durotheca rogersii]KAI5861918.1 hypothetical protein GGS23DRAFT_597940 [Durotheca rogersii]